jgi:two-component system sensor histidine kinase UhpB
VIVVPSRSPAAILFVDDNAASRRLTAEVLRQAGFEVWEAPTGSEALRLVRQHPDLVLLDVCLPDVSGFEVCRHIRADPATASIPVLHLSGVARSSEERTQGLEGGADGYLIKPVEPAELIAHVRALLRLHRAEESLRESEERYRLIAENASAAVFMLDEESTILFANRAAEEVFGYSADELLEQKLTMLMPESLRGRFQAAVARYLATGRRSVRWEGMEVLGRHRSGREIALEVSFGEFRNREGRRRFIGVVRDITARKEAEQALATLSRRLLEVQEAERRHIAHELHDEVGQALTALKITLHSAQQLVPDTPAAPLLLDALGQLDRTMQQLRTLSLGLRPPMLDDLGLVAALRWHIQGVRERTGLAVRLEVDPCAGRQAAELEMACFRVVQEALNNVVQHARAANVSVELRCSEGELDLTVRDDGAGFDVAAARKQANRGPSLGLLGMEERVRLLGGQFGIQSAPSVPSTFDCRVNFA